MLITNRSFSTRMVWILISSIIITSSILWLCLLLRIQTYFLYLIIVFLLILLIIRAITIRYFKLEISEDMISIKFDHPLLKRYKHTDLELPLYKIGFCKLETNMFSHRLCIGVTGKKKEKIFYFNLGILSESNINTIKAAISMYVDKHSMDD